MYLKQVKHVACYLSGSKNSAVAALVHKGRGNFITGIFMKNKFQDEETSERLRENAHMTAQKLQMPIQEITLSDDDWGTFISPVLSEYQQGSIPSLEVLYNRHILFGGLFDKAINEIGGDFIITGHYARTLAGDNIDKWTKFQGNKMWKSLDLHEDETYNLCMVAQACLQKTHFPLGELTKDVVHKIMAASDLSKLYTGAENKMKVPSVDEHLLLNHIKSELPETPGNVYEFNKDHAIGKHEGLHLWQIGQPMDIDGQTFYVAEKNDKTNYIKVVRDANHPILYCDTVFTSLANWSHEVPYDFYEKQIMDVDFLLGCHQGSTPCTLTVGTRNEYCGNDHIVLSSTQPIRAAAPGHVTAFYHREECMGGARILQTGPSKYIMNPGLFEKDATNSGNPKSHISRIIRRIFPKLR